MHSAADTFEDPNLRESLLLAEDGSVVLLTSWLRQFKGIFSNEFHEYPLTYFLLNQDRTLISSIYIYCMGGNFYGVAFIFMVVCSHKFHTV